MVMLGLIIVVIIRIAILVSFPGVTTLGNSNSDHLDDTNMCKLGADVSDKRYASKKKTIDPLTAVLLTTTSDMGGVDVAVGVNVVESVPLCNAAYAPSVMVAVPDIVPVAMFAFGLHIISHPWYSFPGVVWHRYNGPFFTKTLIPVGVGRLAERTICFKNESAEEFIVNASAWRDT